MPRPQRTKTKYKPSVPNMLRYSCNYELILSKAAAGYLEVWQPMILDMTYGQTTINPTAFVYYIADSEDELMSTQSITDRLIAVDHALDASFRIKEGSLRAAALFDPLKHQRKYIYHVNRFYSNGQFKKYNIILHNELDIATDEVILSPQLDGSFHHVIVPYNQPSHDHRAKINSRLDVHKLDNMIKVMQIVLKSKPIVCIYNNRGDLIHMRSYAQSWDIEKNQLDKRRIEKYIPRIAEYLEIDMDRGEFLWFEVNLIVIYDHEYMHVAKSQGHHSTFLNLFQFDSNHHQNFVTIALDGFDICKKVMYKHILRSVENQSFDPMLDVRLHHNPMIMRSSRELPHTLVDQLFRINNDSYKDIQANQLWIEQLSQWMKNKILLSVPKHGSEVDYYLVPNNTASQDTLRLAIMESYNMCDFSRLSFQNTESIPVIHVMMTDESTRRNLAIHDGLPFECISQYYKPYFKTQFPQTLWNWYSLVDPNIIRLPKGLSFQTLKSLWIICQYIDNIVSLDGVKILVFDLKKHDQSGRSRYITKIIPQYDVLPTQDIGMYIPLVNSPMNGKFYTMNQDGRICYLSRIANGHFVWKVCETSAYWTWMNYNNNQLNNKHQQALITEPIDDVYPLIDMLMFTLLNQYKVL